MSDWGKVAIGTRIGEGRCDPLFFRSWQRLILSGLRPGDAVLDPAIEMPHHFAANWLVREFLKSECDSLCLVDSDMVFQADALSKLRDTPAAGYSVLSALATTRRQPISPVVLTQAGEKWVCHNDVSGDAVVEVHAATIGFCVIKRVVFGDIETCFKTGGWYFDWGPRGFGEDTLFSRRARECGHRIGVAPGCAIGHRGAVVWAWDTKGMRPIVIDIESQLSSFGENKQED